ncbi:MAG: hypothetical protein N3D82_06170, partial [Ignisphaera sp.]|nr:hypothetical protein [Ignisphaera sp.]
MEFEWHQIKNEHSCDTEKNSERAKMIFDSLLEGIITEPKKIGFKELIRRRINNMSRKTGRSM